MPFQKLQTVFRSKLVRKCLAATIPCFGCSAPFESDAKSSHIHGVFFRQPQWRLNPSTWTIVRIAVGQKTQGPPEGGPAP